MALGPQMRSHLAETLSHGPATPIILPGLNHTHCISMNSPCPQVYVGPLSLCFLPPGQKGSPPPCREPLPGRGYWELSLYNLRVQVGGRQSLWTLLPFHMGSLHPPRFGESRGVLGGLKKANPPELPP